MLAYTLVQRKLSNFNTRLKISQSIRNTYGVSRLVTFVLESTAVVLTVFLYFRVSITFVYFGLTVISVSVGSNKYATFILVALIELPAYVATYLFMNRFGRKFSLCATLMVSSIPCTAFAFLPPGMSDTTDA
jgi:hypothetical protein